MAEPTLPDDIDDLAAFGRALGALLDVDPEGWAPEDPLADRLGWDSMVALEVVAWLDDAGIHLPDDLLGELRTVGDLHHYARSLAPGAGAVAPRPAGRVPLRGRRVHLVPLVGPHQGAALDLFLRGDNLNRFRLRGTTPSPEMLGQILWDRVLCQFSVLSGSVLEGVVTAFEPDMRNRHVHVAVITRPEAPPGAGAEGLALLIDHLFAQFDLRKVYAEVLEPNAAQFTSALGRVVSIEGRLVDHEYMEGRYHDMLVLAISRERWHDHVDRLLGAERLPG